MVGGCTWRGIPARHWYCGLILTVDKESGGREEGGFFRVSGRTQNILILCCPPTTVLPYLNLGFAGPESIWNLHTISFCATNALGIVLFKLRIPRDVVGDHGRRRAMLHIYMYVSEVVGSVLLTHILSLLCKNGRNSNYNTVVIWLLLDHVQYVDNRETILGCSYLSILVTTVISLAVYWYLTEKNRRKSSFRQLISNYLTLTWSPAAAEQSVCHPGTGIMRWR